MEITADAIFCDEVRIEQNGKLFVIGVYSDDIQVYQLPADIKLTFWVRIWGLDKEICKNDLVVRLGEKEIARASGTIQGTGSHVFNAFLQRVPLHVQEEAEISISIELEDGSVVAAGAIPVVEKA